MKKAVIAITPLLLAAMIFAGCGGGDSDGTSSGGAKTYTDSAETIEVKVGDEFVIALDSNATTGYAWQLTENLDEDVVELVSSEYVMDEEAEEMVGAGGVEEWTFKATGEGSTTISLEYVRPWEEEEPPVREEDFKVEVS
ncbi:MAG: protease inhibitor I42 family protein [Actinomycetota bacterium]|nr:protease inhibitor I42 family protein [Actinomycetota bacterium]